MSRHFDKAEGLSENHDPATHEFVFNQTMFRIKDPKRTLHFYSEVMGMTLIKRFDFPAMEFTLYFMAAISPMEQKNWSEDNDERIKQTFARPAMLELTHNWGDEDKDDVLEGMKAALAVITSNRVWLASASPTTIAPGLRCKKSRASSASTRSAAMSSPFSSTKPTRSASPS